MTMVVGEIEVTKPFYKVVVIEPDIFISRIAEERNFGTREEAEQFQKAIEGNNLYGVICPM